MAVTDSVQAQQPVAPKALDALDAPPAIEARAYGPVVRWGAIKVVGLAALGLNMWQQSGVTLLPWHSLTLWVLWLVLSAAAWFIWRSRTRVSVEGLWQTAAVNKHAVWDKVLYVSWLRWAGFEWLFAPRLYVRALGGRVLAFYVADASAWPYCKQWAAWHASGQHLQKPKAVASEVAHELKAQVSEPQAPSGTQADRSDPKASSR